MAWSSRNPNALCDKPSANRAYLLHISPRIPRPYLVRISSVSPTWSSLHASSRPAAASSLSASATATSVSRRRWRNAASALPISRLPCSA